MTSLLNLVQAQADARAAEHTALRNLHRARVALAEAEAAMQAAEAEVDRTAGLIADADLAVYRAEQTAKDGGIIRLI